MFSGRFLDDEFGILSPENICISVSSYTEVRVMKRMIGLLMMVGVLLGVVGCSGDGDSPTGPGDSDSPTGPREEITKWRKSFGDGAGGSVQQTVDGGFIVTGVDNPDGALLLLKTNELGYIEDLDSEATDE